MQRKFQGLFGILIMFTVIGAADSAHALTEQELELQRVKDRMNSIETQMSTMQRELYRSGGKNKGSQAAINEPIGSDEEKLRAMNGKIEELENSISVLAAKLDKIIADIDFRIAALEKKGEAVASDTASEEKPAETAPQEDAATTKPDAMPAESQPKPDVKQVASMRYDQAIELIKREKYEEAEAAFKDFIANNKDSDLLGNAHYWLAETYYIRKNYQQASVSFLKGYQDVPKGNKAADNLFKLALSLKGLNKTKEACATLSKMKKEFPGGDKDLMARAKTEGDLLKCK